MTLRVPQGDIAFEFLTVTIVPVMLRCEASKHEERGQRIRNYELRITNNQITNNPCYETSSYWQ